MHGRTEPVRGGVPFAGTVFGLRAIARCTEPLCSRFRILLKAIDRRGCLDHTFLFLK